MLRINSELMRQRRIQLGWTSEELAEKSGLDARTIRRLEQGKTRPRLHTAVAVAQALTLETSVFVLNEGPQAGERDPDEDSVAAAFKAAMETFGTELTCDGDTNYKEVTYVLSLLLTRALAREGKGSAEQEGAGVHDVVAAFKAADVAIRATLGAGREMGIEEATSVLSLLLTRYGIAFSRGPNRGPMLGLTMIDIAREVARKRLSDYLTPGGHVHLGEAPSRETADLLSSLLEESERGKVIVGLPGIGRAARPTES